jgi:hypothetical protein
MVGRIGRSDTGLMRDKSGTAIDPIEPKKTETDIEEKQENTGVSGRF